MPTTLGWPRRLDQPVGGALPLLLRLVRMDADRAPDIVVALGDRAHALELVEPRADGQHAGDAGRPGARQHARLVVGELGEVEMAVAVDQHQRRRSCRLDVAREHALRLGQAGARHQLAVERARTPCASAGTPSWSRILPVESGMKGCTSSVTRRIVSASTHSTVSRRTGSVLASAHGACAST